MAIAGVNTAILHLLQLHDALGARGRPQREPARPAGGPAHHGRCSGLTFLCVQINEYVHIGFAPHDNAQGSIFYGLTGLHGATCSWA